MISSPFPIAYRIEDLKRHFLASESNLELFFEAQNIRENFPNASFNTQFTVAAIPMEIIIK